MDNSNTGNSNDNATTGGVTDPSQAPAGDAPITPTAGEETPVATEETPAAPTTEPEAGNGGTGSDNGGTGTDTGGQNQGGTPTGTM